MSYSVSLQGDEAKRSIQDLREALKAEGLAAKVIHSGGEDLDILPAHASKGKGLEFLLGEVIPFLILSMSSSPQTWEMIYITYHDDRQASNAPRNAQHFTAVSSKIGERRA